LYSVGNNYDADGGAVYAAFIRKCQYDEMCAMNATFLLDAAPTE